MKDLKNCGQTNTSSSGRKRLKQLLLVTLLATILIPTALLAIRKGAEAVSSHTAAAPVPATPKGNELFPLANSLLPAAVEQAGRLTASTPDGAVLQYSVNADLQQKMQSYFAEMQPPYALFIALEPSTGRVIALTSSSPDPTWTNEAAYRLFPMASLFKMVTAASALEQAKVTPNTEIAYRGRAISENPNNWDPVHVAQA